MTANIAKRQVEMVRNLQCIKVPKKHILTHSFFQMFDELKKVTRQCKKLKKELIEHERSREELTNSMEVIEERLSVLEEENMSLKEENQTLREEHRKITCFIKGLDREIENVCAYLSKQQDE